MSTICTSNIGKSGCEIRDARKDPAAAPADYLKNPAAEAAADYWKSMMKGEPMPAAIEEILVHDHGAEISVSKQKKEKKRWDPSKISMAHFKRDFDTAPNMIIYHSHSHMGHDDQTHEKSLVKGRAGVIEVSE
ncbi:hypothetical protein C3L33_19515, partial [Rhododendron williamsianum]